VNKIWPTPTQEAMLRLVFGSEEDVATRWQSVQPLELNDLDPGTFCLLPMVHTRLAAAGVDDPLAARIRGTYRSIWYRNQIAIRRLGELLQMLAAEAIEPVVVGGAAVATRFYPEIGHRPLPQFDLVLPPESVAPARRVVESYVEWSLRLDRPAFTRFEDAGRFVVVLHSGLPASAAGGLRGAAALRALLPRTSLIPLNATSMRVLAPADELVVACGMGARATLPASIQWFFDAAFIGLSEELVPNAVAQPARELALVAAMKDVMRRLRDLTGAAKFDAISAVLAPLPAGRREILAHTFGTRSDSLSQGLSMYLRGTTGRSFGRVLRDLPQDARQVDAAGWARRAWLAVRR
jgi:hypothetical protein